MRKITLPVLLRRIPNDLTQAGVLLIAIRFSVHCEPDVFNRSVFGSDGEWQDGMLPRFFCRSGSFMARIEQSQRLHHDPFPSACFDDRTRWLIGSLLKSLFGRNITNILVGKFQDKGIWKR